MPSSSMLGHHYKIRVVLTATSNAFLADRLPLAGELEVFEMTTDGRITPGKAVFRIANPDGTLSAPVHVDDIEFTYSVHPERDRPTPALITNHFWVARHDAWGQQAPPPPRPGTRTTVTPRWPMSSAASMPPAGSCTSTSRSPP
jgi:hypothetical protein